MDDPQIHGRSRLVAGSTSLERESEGNASAADRRRLQEPGSRRPLGLLR
jgi:hypothetical protein